MTKKHSWLLAAFVAGQMVLAGGPFAKSPSQVWAHEQSDLKPEAGIQFGKLPNGMRYAIFKNATPPGQASIRLRIGSGSLNESDAQQGLAHFLEHMAFKGSKRVPEGEMVKILQRKGLAFGPDTNAFDELDPNGLHARSAANRCVNNRDRFHADARNRKRTHTWMRSPWSLSAMLCSRKNGCGIRPPIGPQKRGIETLLEGQLAPKRFPIGQMDVIKNAPANLVKEFYIANYRPDRATLIVVGDIDPAAIEAKIKATFSDWAPAGPATSEPELGSLKSRGLTTQVFEQPGSTTLVSISWLKPYVDAPDTKAKRRKDLGGRAWAGRARSPFR